MLIELALALILVKIVDELFIRKNQPAVIGEILIGIIFSIFNFLVPDTGIIGNYNFSLNLEVSHPAFQFFADTGIILLLFLSGMETNLEDLKKSGKSGLLTGALGVFTTFILVFLFAHFILHMKLQVGIVLATIFTATSVGVTVRTLMDLGILNTKVGNTILTAAVADDVFGIILITLVLSHGEIIEMAVGLSVFFLIIYFLGKFKIIDRVMNLADEYFHGPYGLVTFSLGLMFLFAYLAEISHIAMITGAFFAGLFIGQSAQERKIVNPIKVIAYSLFIPIFFVNVGTLVDIPMLKNFNPYLFAIIPIVFAGKIIGCAIGARTGGVNMKDALRIGVGMVPEMEVALVIVTLAYGKGIFGQPLGSQIMALKITYVIISSLTVPIMLKKLYRSREA
ncbi:MAG: cation:proton antiporter [Thermoplasmata archaeon]|nr:cation:proton antiporter [Thermoplasmata archaeon]